MKSTNFTFAKGMNPFVFCFGMFLLAMTFSVVICFSTFYAFHSINKDGNMSKTEQVKESVASRNVYASAE